MLSLVGLFACDPFLKALPGDAVLVVLVAGHGDYRCRMAYVACVANVGVEKIYVYASRRMLKIGSCEW
jgi:hypothetical protein